VTTVPAQYHIESAPLLFGRGEAVFSLDRVYRYRLSRMWSDRPWGTDSDYALWVMLNPSTADAFQLDPTCARVESFTKKWGLDGFVVVNLFGLCSTDPRALLRHPDPAGPANSEFIAGAATYASVIVAAWGAHPRAALQAQGVMEILAAHPQGVSCLGTTRAGHPRHPLYVKGGTELVPYIPGEM